MINLDRHIKIQDDAISRIESFTTGKNREIVLEHHCELFILLNELKSCREKCELHTVKSAYGLLNGAVYKIECSCGEITNYKVPLRSVSDFECPKRKVTHARKILTS